METTFKWLIAMTRAVLKDEKIDTSGEEEIDWDMLYAWSHFHSISGLVAYALAAFETVPEAVREKFQKEQLLTVFKETKQEAKVQALLKDFEAEGLSCMPLKGFILKHLYPKTDMRDMCDVDILIQTGEYENIKAVMERNGFVFDKESAHEYIFVCKPAVTVELHKTLIPNYNHDLYAYYGDGWKFARKQEGYEHIYTLSWEDFYIYTIVHAAKHYLNGGIGIRQVADIWILRNSMLNGALDQDYIQQEIETLRLTTFHDIICRLCAVWFEQGQNNQQTIQMAEYIVMSGIYGTAERADRSKLYRASAEGSYRRGKAKNIFKMIFPSKASMKLQYPVLKKIPALYPVWIVKRWFRILLFRRQNIEKNLKAGIVADEEIQAFADHCEMMGLRKTL